MQRIYRRRIFGWIVILASGSFTSGGVALGQEMYFGVIAPLGELEGVIDKTVDTTDPGTLVPESRRGLRQNQASSGSRSEYGAGPVLGLRLRLPATGLFVAAEADAAWLDSSVHSQFDGIGDSPGRNQLGEFWPDVWSYDAESSYGATARFGGNLPFLGPLGVDLYALAGLRWIDGTFTNSTFGCLSPIPCSEAADTPNFAASSGSRDIGFGGTVIGVGLESSLGALVLRAELRQTRYDTEAWVTPFTDLRVTVPTALDIEQSELVVGAIWTF